MIDFHDNMQQAVAAKRFHSQWLPDIVELEIEALGTLTQQRLQKKNII